MSRTWHIEGAYTETFSDRNTLQAGLRYRERQFGLGDDPSRPGKAGRQALSSVDLFSRGGVRVQPAVLMEYGLYSTLSDGSLALTPQGGVVFQLGSDWQLETSAAHRVYTDQPSRPRLPPHPLRAARPLRAGERGLLPDEPDAQGGDDDSLTFGAAQRTVGDTLRLYFSDDFFDRSESLYLVRGDKLPELRVGLPAQDLAEDRHQARLQHRLGRRRHLRRLRRPALREPGALPGDLAGHAVPRHLDRGLRGLPPPGAAARPDERAAAGRAGDPDGLRAPPARWSTRT